MFTSKFSLSKFRILICGQVEVSEGNAVEVAEFLANQTSESSSDDAQQVEVISDILTNIVNAGSGDSQVCSFNSYPNP